MHSSRTIAHAGILLAIVVASAAMYLHRLDFAPPNIQIDEAIIAINAHEIATTGHDLRGELLPLYAQTAEHSWYQPMVIYFTAAMLTVAPISEWSIRIPAVFMGVLGIGLMFAVTRLATQSLVISIAAAAMLALTPALFVHSRYAMDYHYPIPFILGWLYCLLRFDLTRRLPWLVAACMIIGVGFYCYISSIVMMPVYFLMTLMWLYIRREPPRSCAAATAGMAPLLVPFLIWIVMHPQAYSATVDKYGLYNPNDLNMVQGLRSAFSFLSVGQRLSQYWNYYDPSLLFFGSGIKVQFSTNLVGVFLLPMAFFMLVGLYAALRRRADPFYLIVLLGFVTAPVAASIPTEENAIFRALGLLPFGVLLAATGLQHLWQLAAPPSVRLGLQGAGVLAVVAGVGYAAVQGQVTESSLPLAIVGALMFLVGRLAPPVVAMRLLAASLLLLLPIQFALFWNDYFSSYRERVSFWLGGNIRGVLEEVIDQDRIDAPLTVYFAPLTSASGQLDWRNGYIDSYWRFYLLKHHRADLLARTRTVDNDALPSIERGSVVVTNLENAQAAALVKSGALREVTRINELDSKPFFVVLRK